MCAGDAQGRTVVLQAIKFCQVLLSGRRSCRRAPFGMEACSTAHHWARFLMAQGHTPKLMAAEFVAPFRKSQGAKNDRNDAQAILAAVRQPDMRFVSVKSVDQQAMLAWHRARAGFGEERKALLNRTRGLLAEFGVWLGRSAAVLRPPAAPVGAGSAAPGALPPDPLLRPRTSAVHRSMHRQLRYPDSRARTPERRSQADTSTHWRRRTRRRVHACDRCQSSGFQERTTDGRLDWPGAAPEQLRR